MSKIFYSILVGLATIVMLLNFFSGIVGGIWLIVTGGIGLVIGGIIAGVVMPWIYTIATLPSMGVIALTVKVLEKNVVIGGILAFVAAFWEKFITLVWVTTVFNYFILQNTHYNSIPLILAAYATTMAPLQSMAGHEKNASGDLNLGTTLGLFFAQFVFLIMVISWILNFSPIGLLWILILLFTIVPIYITIKDQKANQRINKAYVENVVSGEAILEEATAPAIMYCSKCGKQVSHSANFCKHCGEKI